MEKEIIEKFKKALEDKKNSIEKELESFAKKDESLKYNWDARYPNRENGNMEEEADESQEYDNLLSLEQSMEARLKDVILALEKAKRGDYGNCEKCGKPIEENRLLACPEARMCIHCNK